MKRTGHASSDSTASLEHPGEATDAFVCLAVATRTTTRSARCDKIVAAFSSSTDSEHAQPSLKELPIHHRRGSPGTGQCRVLGMSNWARLDRVIGLSNEFRLPRHAAKSVADFRRTRVACRYGSAAIARRARRTCPRGRPAAPLGANRSTADEAHRASAQPVLGVLGGVRGGLDKIGLKLRIES